MPEGLAQASAQRHLTGMTEGCVTQVVTHSDGLSQVFVETQRPGNGGSDSGHLQGVGHAGAVMIALRPQEHLGLVHQTAESLGVDDPVDVPLVAGTHILFPEFISQGTASALIGKSRKGIQLSMLLSLQFFTDGHSTTPFLFHAECIMMVSASPTR